jgi:alkylation response protein AidB-like acyl-CoA dehydrogenase
MLARLQSHASPRAAEFLARARDLVPLLDAAGPRIEAARELTPDVLAALYEAGMFRCLLPESVGGAELDPMSYVAVLETLAGADASTAWCVGQNDGCSMVAAWLRLDVAAEVFGDSRAVLAWGAGAAGIADVVEGGYRVNGTWQFASGSRHATWLGGHCLVREPDGSVRPGTEGSEGGRTMLFPRARATIKDVWHVVGLKGTGSDSYSVKDLFVPEAYSLDRYSMAERREPGLLYRFTTSQLYAAGFAGVALGIARAVLDTFIDLARNKKPRGAQTSLRDSAVTQSEIAVGDARLRAARAFLMQSLREIWDGLPEAGELTMDQRMSIRLASTFAINEAQAVLDTAYHSAGATAIFESGPYERRLRDMHAVAQQAQGRKTHYETVGQHMLGLKPDLLFV